MLEEELKKVIKDIDPALDYIESYKGTLYVCKVKKEDDFFIFKMFDSYAMPDVRDPLSWGREHFDNELKALEKLKGLKGVPLLIQDYDAGRYKALLKEFIDGEKTDSSRIEGLFIERLFNLYFNMHHKGVILPDFKSGDIIVAKEHPFIIDFGYAVFSDRISFELEKQYLRESHWSLCSLKDKILNP